MIVWVRMETRAKADRVNALDVGRGLAIMSVLYGHALAPWFMDGAENFHTGAFLQWKFGAAFLMPFFFFISGAGWRSDASLAMTARKALTLLAMALIASVVFDVVRVALTVTRAMPIIGAEPVDFITLVRNAARMTLFEDRYSLSALWFLAALAMVRMIAAVTIRWPAWAMPLTAAVLLALTIAGNELDWRNFLQLRLIGVAFAAFALGHALRHVWARVDRSLPLTLATLAIGLVITVATYQLNQGCAWNPNGVCGEGWLGGRFGVSMIVGHFGNLGFFAITALSGIAFAAALSMLLSRIAVAGERFAIWGRASLDLLIVNAIFLELANPAIGRYVSPYIGGDNALFYVTLLAVAVVVNLAALALMHRPLRLLRRAAGMVTRIALDVAAWPMSLAPRRDRVTL